MVDSRDKGARAETVARDALRKLTGLKFERVPGSGALDAKHKLKGDLYIPDCKNVYAIEVKHYADDHLTSAVLTGKNPTLLEWWSQCVRQAGQLDRKPLLVFKFDRSKLFVAFDELPNYDYRHVHISADGHNFFVAVLDDWHKHENPKFVY